jgi:hypothetical protein
MLQPATGSRRDRFACALSDENLSIGKKYTIALKLLTAMAI